MGMDMMSTGLLIALIGVGLGALGILTAKILTLKTSATPEEPEASELNDTRQTIVWMTLVCATSLTVVGVIVHFLA